MKKGMVIVFWGMAGAAFSNAIDNMAPGTWLEVPNSNMRDVCPTESEIGEKFYQCGGVIGAWSGGAFDTGRDKLIVFGGGHGDSPDNSIYLFSLNTLKWERVAGPGKWDRGTSSPYYPDGTPRSRHSYNYLQYFPLVDRFCSLGGAALYPSGNHSTNIVDCYEFGTGVWVKMAEKTQGGNINSISAVDPVTGHAFYHAKKSSSRLLKFDPVANKWSTHTSNPFGGIARGTAVVDPLTRRFLNVASSSDVVAWNLKNLSEKPVKLSTSGASWSPSGDSPGAAYHPPSGRVVAWHSGQTVYSLEVGSGNWTAHKGTGANPGSPSRWGTYGRFRYSPNKNVFVVVSDVDDNVFAYKPDFGNPTAAEPMGISEGLSLRVSPNPARGVVSFQLSVIKKEKTRIAVLDVSGKKVLDLIPDSQHMNTRLTWNPKLAPGTYLIVAKSGNQTAKTRITVLN